jgi:SP family general alpha glucoside:H+ symporter-like MFS transporter
LLWPLVILVSLPFAPESPWWLVRQGRIEDAEHALKRLSSRKVDVKQTLAMAIETDRIEYEMEAGSTYMDCFEKVNLRRTETAVGVYAIRVLSGIYLAGYVTYFFERKCLNLRSLP